MFCSLHHAHAFIHRHLGSGSIFLLLIGNHTFGGQEHAGNRCCIFQCNTGYFGRIDHTGFIQILILIDAGIVPEIAFSSRTFCTTTAPSFPLLSTI